MNVCLCVKDHRPAMYVTNRHHVLPQSWGGKTVDANLVDVCPNTHTSTHQLINAYIHAGGEPTWDVLQHYTALSRDLAARAWAQRPLEHPPYTLAHS